MPLIVVAALIAREGRILISQREAGKHMGLLWEFPGGKMEKGESPEQALERELMEELGIKTKIGRIYDAARHSEGIRDIVILFYRAEILAGEPSAIECRQFQWVEPSKLREFPFPPADLRVISRIESAENDL